MQLEDLESTWRMLNFKFHSALTNESTFLFQHMPDFNPELKNVMATVTNSRTEQISEVLVVGWDENANYGAGKFEVDYQNGFHGWFKVSELKFHS